MRLVALFVAVLAGFAGVAMSQDRLLYFPEKVSVAEAVRLVPHARPWPSAEAFRALVVEPAAQPAKATIIVFHGNAGHAGHRGFYAEAMRARGWRVLLAEYPAYGPRDGKPGEENLVADAAETVALAHSQFGEPLYLLGESLGAGVAAAASARLKHAGIAGLLLVTPWDRLQSVASYHYPWLPVSWLLRDRYDSAENLSGFRGRIAVVLAEDDSIVPARFGGALHDSLQTDKMLRIIKGADHNDWVERTDTAWWQSVLNFLRPAAEGQ